MKTVVTLLALFQGLFCSRLLKKKSAESVVGFKSLASGLVLEEQYVLGERLRWYSIEKNSQLWQAVSTKDSTPILIRFYTDYLAEEQTEDTRLLTRADFDSAKKALEAEQKQTQLADGEDGTASMVQVVQLQEMSVPPKSSNPSSQEGIIYEKYMHTPLFTIFQLPKGDSLNQRCATIQCKDMLRLVAKGVLSILSALQKARVPYGNIHQDNVFIDISNKELQMANMLNLQILKESKKALGEEFSEDDLALASEQDLADLGMLLVWMMVPHKGKDTSFLKSTKTSMDLFKHLNPSPSKYSDFSLGVAKVFYEGKEHRTQENLLQSYYDFVMRLLGKKGSQENSHEAFDSLESVMGHPFISRDIPYEQRPSDV